MPGAETPVVFFLNYETTVALDKYGVLRSQEVHNETPICARTAMPDAGRTVAVMFSIFICVKQ